MQEQRNRAEAKVRLLLSSAEPSNNEAWEQQQVDCT